jgi:hypothetical protein
MFHQNARHTGRVPKSGLTAPQVSHDGAFECMLEVETGQSYSVEVSADLIHWNTAANFSSTNWLVPFRDPDAASVARRFYRLLPR